ncbi:hypothetical protein O181_008106 [Austropuccinia psidii MF-1]|uniref:Reverse transcriptase/retrotransposon-derived protein RNase H-like domain-containing protein n=1 Tax=Austropuccinia psidii MF-1 TaxID=1389203 RepID=A0A9Q3BM07_9BASI|nr:hypothetical protein [Austropuccinia psidii MF-1]
MKNVLKKCNFGQKEPLELGHNVSGLSLTIDQNKVKEVLQKPVPNRIEEMQSFFLCVIYYRNQIKNLSHLASSRYTICSKDVLFEVTKERRDAYESIKNEITSSPVLMLPNFELSIRLDIDAACISG